MSLKSEIRKLAPRAPRAYRILSGPLRGQAIVTSLHDYPAAILGRTEKPLLAWFRNNVRLDETWLDIGAHYGYTALALAGLVGRNGRVYAFEPSLSTVSHLSKTCALNKVSQVTVVPFGLGEAGDIRIVAVAVDRGMANHDLGGTTTENIYVVGFDHLWASIGSQTVHGIKIDVQGMEWQVLQGMTETLANQRPKLVIEFHPKVDRKPILEALNAAGYKLPATPIAPLSAESEAAYYDDRSYAFEPRTT